MPRSSRPEPEPELELGLDPCLRDRRARGREPRRAPGLLVADRRAELRPAAVAPRAEIRLTIDPPIVGAALLALDAAGRGNGANARAAADDRLRAQLGAAVRNEEAGRAARLAAAGVPVAEARIEAELELGLGSGGARHDG